MITIHVYFYLHVPRASYCGNLNTNKRFKYVSCKLKFQTDYQQKKYVQQIEILQSQI